MNIKKIQSALRIVGIDSQTSWCGRADGCYLKARIKNTNKAIVSLIPIADEDDNNFIEFIKSKCETKPNAPKGKGAQKEFKEK